MVDPTGLAPKVRARFSLQSILVDPTGLEPVTLRM